jgi:hypothetical protein
MTVKGRVAILGFVTRFWAGPAFGSAGAADANVVPVAMFFRMCRFFPVSWTHPRGDRAPATDYPISDAVVRFTVVCAPSSIIGTPFPNDDEGRPNGWVRSPRDFLVADQCQHGATKSFRAAHVLVLSHLGEGPAGQLRGSI